MPEVCERTRSVLQPHFEQSPFTPHTVVEKSGNVKLASLLSRGPLLRYPLRRRMHWLRFFLQHPPSWPGSLLLFLPAVPLFGQPETPVPLPPVERRGVATVELAASSPLAVGLAETSSGPLFELAPLVGRLGGRLEPGEFGSSYQLSLGNATYLLVPGSLYLTLGAELLPLSQPVQELELRPFVPLDLLEATYTRQLELRFRWSPESRRLLVERPAVRELPVEVEAVSLQGVTTLVLRFPERPRYRIVREENRIDVVFLGDRVVVSPYRLPEGDLLKRLEVERERIRLEPSPGVQVEDYELKDPVRLVFDLYRKPTGTPPVAPAVEPPMPRGLRTVVLDPGHGGEETGAIGPKGSAEKDLTLTIARRLRDALSEQLGVRVLLTREEDVSRGLDERAALANQVQADLFLSLHLNSTVRGQARGVETYILSLQASDRRASDAAAIENYSGNLASSEGDPLPSDLRALLWDLAQSQHLAQSQRLALLLQEELARELGQPDRGVKQAPFRVLMGAAMPAVLVELGFLSNPEEEQLLLDPAYQERLVGATVRAIQRFGQELEAAAGTANR